MHHAAFRHALEIRAVDLPQEARDRYQLSGFGPWLLITETAVTPAGIHILYAQDYHRGSIFAFNVLRR